MHCSVFRLMSIEECLDAGMNILPFDSLYVYSILGLIPRRSRRDPKIGRIFRLSGQIPRPLAAGIFSFAFFEIFYNCARSLSSLVYSRYLIKTMSAQAWAMVAFI